MPCALFSILAVASSSASFSTGLVIQFVVYQMRHTAVNGLVFKVKEIIWCMRINRTYMKEETLCKASVNMEKVFASCSELKSK